MYRILPLGDSITQGSPDHPGGYRGTLERLLVQGGFPEFDFVGGKTLNSHGLKRPRHEGHPGFRIEQIRLGYTSDHSSSEPIPKVLATYQPDCVLLLAGTNNIYFDAPEVVAEEARLLIGEIAPLPVLLATVLPILPGPKPWGATIPDDVGARVDRLNALLSDLAAESPTVTLVDLSGCVSGADDLLEDGVHPTGDALDRVAERFAAALLKLKT